MNKTQFLDTLNVSLKQLSVNERNDILQDFREHFKAGIAEGKTESDISAALGSPYKIAKELLETYDIEETDIASLASSLRLGLIATGVVFFNLIIVLGPLMALVGIMFAGWIIGLTFIASPGLVLLGAAIYLGSFVSFDLFISLALAGLGLLTVMGMYYVTGLFIRLLRWYLTVNIDFVKGGGSL